MKLKYTLLIATSLLFTACSDKKEEKKVPVAKAGKIEVTSNSNIYEKKVKEVEDKSDRSYYYSYNKNTEAKKQEERTTLDANMRVRSPYEKVQVSMLVSRLSKDFIVKCSACHNDYANGVIGPSLLKKDETFIFNQIMAFKTGEKENILMTELVKQLDEKHIRKLANEIATFNKKIEELKAK